MGTFITKNESYTTQRLLVIPEQGLQTGCGRSVFSQTVKFRLSPAGDLTKVSPLSRTQLIKVIRNRFSGGAGTRPPAYA